MKKGTSVPRYLLGLGARISILAAALADMPYTLMQTCQTSPEKLLAEGADHTFFMEVAGDGIALYQSDDTPFHQPKPKTPAQALAMAREYYEDWLPSAQGFMRGYRHGVADGDLKKAAFDLHQACERLYHCALLVVTFYTPHVHNLGFLRTQAERLDRRLTYVWPMDNRKHRAMFEKLKEAYVKARYSKHYRITKDELEWLGAQVEELGRVVHEVCSERIDALKNEAGKAG